MAVIEWLLQYKWVIIFYLAIAILVYINRKKWQVESKFILIYRTKFGIKFMDKIADNNKELIKTIGYSAIGIGFVGMIVIVGFFIKGLYDLFFVPDALPTMSLVIPGIQIPGSPIFVPFWYGIIALFIVVVFHEFGHGIVARAHGIPVKNTGLVLFGPLPGAFVEPDEKKIKKSPSAVQTSMFASGPFFNVILAAIVALLLFVVLNPALSSMVNASGVKFTNIQEGYAADTYGLEKNVVYTKINGQELKDTQELIDTLSCTAPGTNLTFSNDESEVIVTLGENPTNKGKGYLGVTGLQTDYVLKSSNWWYSSGYNILFILTNLLEWVFMLSLGIGLANLLPLGPVDGGRMLHTTLVDMKGKDKGTKLWMRISLITFIVLLILVLVPIIKTVVFKM
ncbi:MAG: site-2 protease family protein [Candidatus Woesearchaeota archaeon]